MVQKGTAGRLITIYGVALGALLLLLRWLEFRFVIIDHAFQVYVGSIALIFMCLGIWLTLKLAKPKVKVETVVVEKEVFVSRPSGYVPDDASLDKLGISRREWEVLSLIAAGMSNQEIAEKLFVSQNTIKTHSSNLFFKLGVKRRIQAVEKAKELGILA